MSASAAGIVPRRSSLWFDAWGRFVRDRLALTGAIVLAALALVSAAAPLLTRYAPNDVDLRHLDAAPASSHWFGTDDLGRDEFSRALYAGRVSLSIGVAVAVVAAFAGTTVGAIAGYHGRLVDAALMRLTDVALSVPPLPLIIVLSAVVKPSPQILVLIIAGVGWMGTARLVRSAFLSIRETEYVEAARAVGCGSLRVIIRHALPNSLAPVIVAATLAVGNAIITESVLSFLGVGIQPPTASWGNMLQNAESTMATKPWLSVFPGVLILLSVLSVNGLGDGLRDAMDVRAKE